MVKARRRKQGALAALALVGATIGWLCYRRLEDGRIRFLERYERHRTKSHAKDQPDSTPFWKPVIGGTRIYCFRGNFEEVVRVAEEELVPKGWTSKRSQYGHYMQRGNRDLRFWRGRSVTKWDPKLMIPTRVIYWAEDNAWTPFRGRSPKGNGWISIDYGWQSESSIVRKTRERLFGPDGSGVWP